MSQRSLYLIYRVIWDLFIADFVKFYVFGVFHDMSSAVNITGLPGTSKYSVPTEMNFFNSFHRWKETSKKLSEDMEEVKKSSKFISARW